MAMRARRPRRLRWSREGICEFQFSCVAWGWGMSGVSIASRVATTEIVRQERRATDTSVGDDVLANIAKHILWPENTAPELAAACGCSTRMAERYLGGHCEWSGDAIAAIMGEILKRRGMRNVRVKARP
jgi:hypothetical protein